MLNKVLFRERKAENFTEKPTRNAKRETQLRIIDLWARTEFTSSRTNAGLFSLKEMSQRIWFPHGVSDIWQRIALKTVEKESGVTGCFVEQPQAPKEMSDEGVTCGASLNTQRKRSQKGISSWNISHNIAALDVRFEFAFSLRRLPRGEDSALGVRKTFLGRTLW